MNEEQKINVIDSLIGIMTTPVRCKEKGISPEDCEVWVEELEKYKENEDRD